jgi:hypothetical protein
VLLDLYSMEAGFAGSATVAAQPFAVAGAGTETFSGSGSAAVSPFAVSAAGAEVFTGTGSAAVQPFAVAGVGEYVPLVISPASAGRQMATHGRTPKGQR